MSVETQITVDVRLPNLDSGRLRRELRDALTGSPRTIPSHFFYDDHGSRLFERICEQPEYYQTRTERAILDAIAPDVVERTEARDLVELGSGASTKTRVLLDAMSSAGILERYVPVDVSEGIVRRSAQDLAERYPGLTVHAVIADFVRDLGALPDSGHQLGVFLGGTIGNFRPAAAAELLGLLGESLGEGAFLLVGMDLIKDPQLLEAAYNDAQGVTAEFNRNILSVVNRICDGDFNPDAFSHRAIYNEEQHRIEMWLDAQGPQRVQLRDLDLTLDLADREGIRTEISVKYNRALAEDLLRRAGFNPVAWYPDSANRFALALAQRNPES